MSRAKAQRWQMPQGSPASCETLAAQLSLPPLVAQCLANRGCADAAAAREFLEPRLARLGDPFLVPDMHRAVERLVQARAAGERFVIFGDYDVDGVTSTALLTEFFGKLGWRSLYYLPHRLDEGYGLTADAVRNCLRQFPVKLILAVDCGSSSGAVIAELAADGIETIVLDHHQVSDPAPPARALVNPQRAPGDSPLRALCSAGLAFKLAHALLKRGRGLGWPGAADLDLRQWLDLVALGTIADLVPLRGENRVFARAGLERLGQTERAGLKALKCAAAVGSPVTAQEVAFQLAPRLNAAGRLETALDALELLLTCEEQRAQALAQALDEQNRERQALEQKIADEAIAAARARFDPQRDFAVVEGRADWHLGVVGIVASRVLREFHRPVFILGGGGSEEWRGSGRSIEGLDLAAALRQCSEVLLKHGGHAMAAGVTLRAERVEEFRQKLNECARAMLSPEMLERALRIDAEVSLAEITFPTLKQLEALEPCGQGNPPVHLAARRLRLRGAPRRFGSAAQHLRFAASDGRASQAVVWWNCPEIDESLLAEPFDLAFVPELNEYNGTLGIQLRLLDIRPATA